MADQQRARASAHLFLDDDPVVEAHSRFDDGTITCCVHGLGGPVSLYVNGTPAQLHAFANAIAAVADAPRPDVVIKL